MAWATVSGVPTSALELPAPPVAAAVRVHSARSNRSPSSAIAISRCDPVFSGFPTGRRRLRAPPPAATRASMRSTMSCAFSHAFASVGAMIGRKATWILGTSVRPASLAACLTHSICSAVLASGSPHKQEMSGLAPPARGGGGRGPAERHPGPGLLHREDVADEVGELIVPAVVVERLPRRPRLLDDRHVLAGALVPFVLREVVALALLLVVGAAGDEVDRRAAAAHLVDGGGGLGRDRRIGDVGPVREQELEGVRLAGDIGGADVRVGCARP